MSNTEKDSCGGSGNLQEMDAFIGSDILLEYKMDHNQRGQALIFNQETFSWELNMGPRKGTNEDRLNLERRFKELNFEVRPYNNLTKEKVLAKIGEAAEADHSQADCFVCVFLSHGDDGHVYAYDGKISIKEVTALFKGDKCRSLAGKPKIFILQACRGDQYDPPVTGMCAGDSVAEENQVVMDAAVVHTLPAGADFLMCYSVAEGYNSFRDPINGSWYIQDLCKTLQRSGQSLEFTELLTLVNMKVSQRAVMKSEYLHAVGKKQIPCFASMLTKKLYFRPKQ
ncbi:hypothetical protein NHX12_018918 [Muraenolepis orangiensis]|uniref:Caspase-6 n=1 Tax=Muraenolepis orangiensis TaxID=630683 RepID=A0A9Q0EXJ7_9TELE|nr:hypothetical protein NHX12_018918 [Muraenolepis orangiensis]